MLRHAVPLLCGLAGAAGAQVVDPPPVEWFVGETVTHDSNIFRVERDTAALPLQADTRFSTAAGVNLSLPVSRQRIDAGARIAANRYRRFGELDHQEHEARATWLWQAGDLLEGRLGAATAHRLASFSSYSGRLPDMLDQRRLFGEANLLLAPSWRLQAGLAGETLKHDRRTTDNIDSGEATLAVDYLSRAGNAIGPSLRVLDVRFPHAVPAADFRQHGAGVRAAWAVSDRTRLDMRLEQVRRDFSAPAATDLERTLYRLDGDWQATEKLGFGLLLQRDFVTVEDVDTRRALYQGIALRPRLAVTEKTRLSMTLDSGRRDYAGDPAGRRDRLQAVGLSLSFRPMQTVDVGVQLQREKRASNLPLGSYEASLFSVSARLSF